MSDIILEMQHITKEFSGVKALDDVTFKVKRGEIHALCGENGAGKSTLMNVLSGVWPYGTYSGDVIYKGEVCKFHKIKDSEEKGIVIIHQELALSPYLSVAENVFMGNEQKAAKGVISWTKTRTNAKAVLARVGLEDEDVNIPVFKLGVGKQQLIEIAKAMAKDVELLILDEPTAALNDEESAKLLELMLELKKQGITSIIISHKLNEISYVADSITIIRDGKTIETLDKEKDDFSEERIIKGMVGRELTNRYPLREGDDYKIGEKIMEVEDWSVYHPEDADRQIIKNVSFNVRAGEVVGFAGLMGAGRTELAMSLFGKEYGQKITGTIKMHGKEVKINNVKDAIEHKIAYTSEDRKTYGLVLIDDIKHNMSMAALRRYFSNHGIVDKNKEILKAEEYKKLINVKANSINQEVGSLSGGNQQKVVLAKWMLAQPDVLILDEPTRGIDVGAKYEIYTAINELAKAGKAIIVISSELPEIIGTCDRAYVINEGRIAGELYKEDLSQERIMGCVMADNRKGDA
ncbi:putative multiple sugar transport system ATP-binding protein [Lachnospiraceae bacterium PF1-21]|uniref:Sugar ABC transporter ATP-binding protein n=1 Tax=Ohessyouella blattaphilus TaxID=2949333 RepID=A0ABT1EES8_9FIRM|nr:multiple monosaccharide ABC transporter ATP-binding protein [Ohessyouella blattaphilus]MCP1109011.1 sugar ABC transporter ATP-binding protein [Ohessyouella blattaphilus]MCR8562405.1 sugar ABC transporter ATP-binding protein [Ohessyouella blattaphilus]MDL2249748.1 ATP-binding cassette domain-containing protein [Lachnospiraceae bacterium OttesenSCG-928-J05]